MMIRVNKQGFTLVELLVTLAIASILFTVALPSFQTITSASNTDNTTARMANIFAYARSEAVSRAERITVCASTDGVTCNALNSTDWNSQWLVMTEASLLIKMEDVSSLNVTFTVFDNLGAPLNNVLNVCFNRFGEICVANFPSITFRATSNDLTSTSSRTLNLNGAVSL
jgi:type IV fimbrial biogenesis protein FimT